MAQLIVRNIENEVKEKLRRRAIRHGHSMEEEIRDILRNAVKGDGRHSAGGLGTEIAALFAGMGLKQGEEIPELRGHVLRPPLFP
jgi:plasmid stability protein